MITVVDSLIRIIMGIMPVILTVFVEDILKYTQSIKEGLVQNDAAYNILIERQEVLTFLISFSITAMVTALNSLIVGYSLLAIIWFIASLLVAFSVKPVVNATDFKVPLYSAKRFIIKKKTLLVIAIAIGVTITEVLIQYLSSG